MVDTSYLDTLNPAQREAVEYLNGSILIVAGAGSGKTRVLTYRVAHLLQSGIPPKNILALTFTNKAATEMTERVAKVVGKSKAANLTMGTFHSIFLRILKNETDKIGYQNNFTIYDTSAAQTLAGRIVKELDLDKEIYKSQLIASRISRCKNALILPEAYTNDPIAHKKDLTAGIPEFGNIYATYYQRMRAENVMDFDDLLVNTYLLFRNHPDRLAYYQDKFQYIMVDEFQDTNDVQNQILNLLAQKYRNLCVVGDDAQSIYAFRGANLKNILTFQENYPETKVVKLVTNYRSTPEIVNAANRLIAKNTEQIPKECQAAQASGEKIIYNLRENEREEALGVAQDIRNTYQSRLCTYNQFAILYRASHLSRILEEKLRAYNIPYKIYGGRSFYQRKEVMELLAYYNFVVNPLNDDTLLRIINLPTRGIGEKAQKDLTHEARQAHLSLWAYIESLPTPNTVISKPTLAKIIDFRESLKPHIASVNTTPVSKIAEAIYTASSLNKLYSSGRSADDEARNQNLRELLKNVHEFEEQKQNQDPETLVTLEMFLSEISLLTDADNEDKDNRPTVTLTTIHSAKGLEFDYVYLVGMNENIFPSERSLNEIDGIEEERRLCYVAVTRAAKRLTVSSCNSRFMFQGGNRKVCAIKQSRFISELGLETSTTHHYLADTADSYSERPLIRMRRPSPTTTTSYHRTNFQPQHIPNTLGTRAKSNTPPVTTSDYTVGDRVQHPHFGDGEVLRVMQEGLNSSAYIRFDDGVERTLLLRIARLKKLT